MRLRDDAGKWIDYSQQNDDNIPMLGFYRVLYPQRVVKLPQLLEHDRDLYYVRKRLSLVLGEKGLLPFDLRNSDIMTPAQFMDMLIDNMGTAEAMKQNRGFFKITLHVQDNGLPHENDWEEFWPKETYDQFLAQYEYVPGGVLIKDVYQKTNFGARDIRAKMLMLLQIVERWPVISAQKAIERFFKAYFRELNSEYVQGFIHAIQTAGIESYLDAIIDSRLEDKLVRELRVNINRIKREIIKWAAEELDSRQGRKISAVTMRRFESHGSKWTGADDKISQLPEQAI